MLSVSFVVADVPFYEFPYIFLRKKTLAQRSDRAIIFRLESNWKIKPVHPAPHGFDFQGNGYSNVNHVFHTPLVTPFS